MNSAYFLGICFAGLMILGLPLYLVLGFVSLYCFHFLSPSGIITIVTEFNKIVATPAMVALPLFTFAGYILSNTKTPDRVVNLAKAFFGWMPGNLGIVAILTSALFTAFTGATGITIVAIGGLLYPILIRAKYPERFSLGLITTCGSVGLLFAPSLPIIAYGVISMADINSLFLAGVFPGIILIVILSAYSMIAGGREAWATREKITFRQMLGAVNEAKYEIPLPFIILIGIYGGILSASEASAITVVYVLIVEFLIYRDIPLKNLPKVIKESSLLAGAILIIITMGLGVTNFMVEQRVPDLIVEHMSQVIHSKIIFLLVLNIFLLIVGCLMDIFSAIIIVVPLIVPVAVAYGVDPVHLGIIFLTNLEIGYITPPVGLNLFISSFRFQVPLVSIYRRVLPFFILLVFVLMLITYWPDLSLYLVHKYGPVQQASMESILQY
ncbi:MAG: TRAP transporter large permease subunit [Proteobacteria bacterium]|nr:TRAP transporter large permease subunit [Pseudomonadota bacterium]